MAYLNKSQGRLVSANRKGQKLSPKMIEFIDLYMVHQNATQAVEESSYKSKSPAHLGYELMQHPLVQEEVAKRLAARTLKTEVKADYLINKLMMIIEDTEKNNPTAALRAIELAGKSIALWKERQEISGPDGEAIRHEQSIKESVADFTSRISGLAQRHRTDNVTPITERSGTRGA